MTNEEAKQVYYDALDHYKSGGFEAALELLDRLDSERPNSRNVTYQRALCFVRLGQLDAAQACCPKLEGKLEAPKMQELQAMIGSARAAARAPAAEKPAPVPNAAPAPAAPRPKSDANVLIIESVFPVGANETTVTGHVQSGVFRTGDSMMIISPEGMPLLAPVLRIGTAETPMKIVREGQKAIMLLEVESHHVAPGSSATCEEKEEAYAATMVVGTQDSQGSANSMGEVVPEVQETEKLVRAGHYERAKSMIDAVLAGQDNLAAANWLAARIHLDEKSPFRDPKKALGYARKAYEFGGSEDPRAVDTLAHAMGVNGEAEHGLRFFERLHSHTADIQARSALVKRIFDFRSTYSLGHVWEFSDSYGEVVFEASSIDEIVTAISNNTVARDAKCRRDRVDEWRSIEASLVPEYPEIAALYKQAKPGGKPLVPILVAVVVVLAAVAAYFSLM